LPFPEGTRIVVSRNGHGPGNKHCSSTTVPSNPCISYEAIDFVNEDSSLNCGQIIVAARAGCVRRIEQNNIIGGRNIVSDPPNFIIIDHGDGFESSYLHITYNSALVNEGDFVLQGQPIAIMGNVGYTYSSSVTCNPPKHGYHLHFQVQTASTNGCADNNAIYWKQSLPVTFDDVLTNNGNPRSGITYISNNSYVKPINQSLPIYGGTIANPNALNIYFNAADFDANIAASASFTIPNGFRIQVPNSTAIITIPSSAISQTATKIVDGETWRHFTVNLTSTAISSLPSNGYKCNIGFDVVTGSLTKHFHGDKQLYFLDPSTLTDIGTTDDKWYDQYVKLGVGYGLFRGGSPATTTETVNFNPIGNLTKGQAAAVVVMAAVKLGFMNINTSSTPYSDVSSTHQYYPYVQTLRHYGI
jgi:murein DD-endopeptidase MepM/ murein hydrolase activator NlpD